MICRASFIPILLSAAIASSAHTLSSCPALEFGDECIVGSGSVVTKDVPSGSIVAGNPARVVRSEIRTQKWGILVEAYEEAVAMENADRGAGLQSLE